MEANLLAPGWVELPAFSSRQDYSATFLSLAVWRPVILALVSVKNVRTLLQNCAGVQDLLLNLDI